MIASVSEERAVLACMMQNQEYAEDGMLELTQDDFTEPNARRVFSAMECLNAAGSPIDMVTVGGMFDSPDMLTYVTTIYTDEFLPMNFKAYLAKVKQSHLLRTFIRGMQKCISTAEDGNVDGISNAQSLLDMIGGAVKTESVKLLGDSVDDAIADFGETRKGTSTGYPRLDWYIKGLIKGNMIVVAGRPSMGKSAFAENIAVNVAAKGGVVAMFSLEMRNTEIAQRVMLGLARTSEKKLLSDNGNKEIERLLEASETTKKMKFYSNDEGAISASKLRTICKKIFKREGKLDLVVVDYIGLMQTTQRKNGSRTQEIGEITHSLKQLAMELSCTVICVAQLNRGPEMRSDHTPIISDLRESGDIEQDADIILFPFRPSVYDDECDPAEAHIIIAKNRNGETGKIRLNWLGESFLFNNPATAEEEEFESEMRNRKSNNTNTQRRNNGSYSSMQYNRYPQRNGKNEHVPWD